MPYRFLPTIYEHAAPLIGKTPSDLARSAELLAEGQLAAYRLYGHDLISVGLDIYNIEAEALGAKVKFYENNDLPSLEGVLINSKADFENMRVPNPETDGRMPLMLKACEIIQKNVPPGVMVSGSFTGPFTLAAILRGFENFISDILDDPDFARRQLEFAAETGIAFASAFLRRGASAAINDSWIAPPLLSPGLYEEFVFDVHRKMIAHLKSRGAAGIALIAGGNTTPIIEMLSQTGSSLIMADWNCDRKEVMGQLKGKDLILRACVEPKLIETGGAAEMEKCVKTILDDYRDYPKLVIGCGIVSINTTSERVLAFREILERC